LRVLVLGIALLLAGAACGTDQGVEAQPAAEGTADYRYVVPAGSGEAIDRGEVLDLFPAALEVQVGEVIEIVNDDDRGHLVGPFFIGANETIRQELSSPGEYEGICTVHSSGRFVLTVVA